MEKKELAKQKIQNLITKYQKVVEENRLKDYKEEETKKDFITPLFHALGWDTEDKLEVSAEENVSKDFVDYGFRINGIPKFFLEAKPLKAKLSDPKYIQKAINYAHLKGCTWAVLTDFESVMIFNAEWKESNPLRAWVKTIHYDEYLKRFEELWLLSKDGFEKGLLDIEAEKWGKKVKKVPAGKQLLSDLMGFRDGLTKNILKNNPSRHLTGEELDETVQRIIDRLIFIRACEDRELEAPILSPVVRESSHKKISTRLNEEFRKIDKEYNSKLFALQHQGQPHLCEDLQIDDEVLKEVILGLYSTEDDTVHYDFQVMPADVLGNIYEQYLGHILKKTEKRAKITSGQAYRREKGIYYTPTYIVNYIVEKTIGQLAKNKRFDIDALKVLDPACGSGSFLIKAYDFLYLYHTQSKTEHQETFDFIGAGAGPTFSKKSQILKNNLFGVDLDPKAIEIAQLNLLLKIAEKRRRLPLLQENIQQGNSLIDDPNVAGDDAFKWEEKFKEIIPRGGFEVVIGNPPWISFGLRGVEKVDEKEDKYYRAHYDSAEYKLSTYVLFIERAIRNLKNGGRLAFILPDSFLLGRFFSKLRRYILDECKVEEILFTEFDVFAEKATTGRNVILTLEKKAESKKAVRNVVRVRRAKSEKDFFSNGFEEFSYSQNYFEKTTYNRFRLFFNKSDKSLVDKMDKNPHCLGEFLEPYSGCIGRYGQKSIISSQPQSEIQIFDKKGRVVYHNPHALSCWRPLLPSSSNVRKYFLNIKDKKYVYLDPDNARRKIYAKSGFDLERYQSEKLFMPQTGDSLVAAYSNKEIYCINNVHLLTPKKGSSLELKYLLALLNSKLINYYYHTISLEFGRTMAQIDIETLEKIPIALPKNEAVRHQLILLVDKMMDLNMRDYEFGDKQTNERERINGDINEINKKIDEFVYQIYRLKEKERKIVEKKT